MVMVKPIVHEIKTASPWIQKTIWDQKERKPSGTFSSLSGITYGQLLFGGTTALSLFKIITNIFSGNDSSIWKKYIFPAAFSVLGVFGVAVSTPGEKNFECDLLNIGVVNVIEKIQKALTGNNLVSVLLDEDFQDNVRAHLSRMLSKSSPLISRLIPPGSTTYNQPLKELVDLADVPDDFTLEKLREFIEQITPREFYRLIKSEPELFGKLFYRLFDPERGILNREMCELENYINETVLKPYGLSVNIDYNSKKRMFDINLTTTDIFSKSDRRSLYKPFVLFSLPPEKLSLAIYQLDLALTELKEILSAGEKLSDREVLLAGISAIADRVNIGSIRAGYFAGGAAGNIHASGKVVGEVKDLVYLSTKKQIRNFLGELVIDEAGISRDRSLSSSTPISGTSVLSDTSAGRSSTIHAYNDNGTSTFTDGAVTHSATAVASHGPGNKPEFAIVGGGDGMSQLEALCQVQEEELKFKPATSKDLPEVLLLNYWLTIAHIRKQKGRVHDGTLYVKAEAALNSRMNTLDLNQEITDSKTNSDVKFENGKLVLHDKYLELKLFNKVLGLAQDVPVLAKKRTNDYMKVFELLRKDQQIKMQDKFFERYYSGNSTA